MEIANRFNEYFISSIEEIYNNIRPINPISMNNMISSNFSEFDEVSINDLADIVHTLKNKNSIDGIHVEILKRTFDVAGYALLNLIQTSLKTGEFPEVLKKSTVTPIPKIVGSNNSINFRPINVLPVVEKIFEKVVQKQLMQYFERNNLFTECQSGFRKKHSCETALQLIISDWREETDNNNVICAVFLDLKRAFETVDRTILIKKLGNYGIGGSVLKWFKQYLVNRKQCVKWQECVSSEKVVNIGVPQGSVLGSSLFIIYINDIVEVVKNSKIHLFADDTLIYVSGTSVESVIRTINEDLGFLSVYFKNNYLSLNISKTKGMVFCKKSIYDRYDSSINGIYIIEIVSQVKYLGVIIDRKLTFKEHLKYVISKIGKKTSFLRRISNLVSMWTTKTIYNTIILPHYNYCGTLLYLVCNKEALNSLQKQQNQAMRAILKCNKFTKIESMSKSLEWFSVEIQLEYNCLLFIYKMLHNCVPEYLCKKIVKNCDKHNYNTRGKMNLYLKKCTKSKAQKCLFIKGFAAYNKLDDKLKDSRNIKMFSQVLKKYYRDKR